MDKCTVELEGLIETVKDIDQEFCQKYCAVIYTGICKFFIYDRKQRICNLLSEPLENYIQTCRKIAGPKTPSFDECTGSLQDPCNVSIFHLQATITISKFCICGFDYSQTNNELKLSYLQAIAQSNFFGLSIQSKSITNI